MAAHETLPRKTFAEPDKPVEKPRSVKITDIDIPVWSMMKLIVCFWIATLLIAAVLGFLALVLGILSL